MKRPATSTLPPTPSEAIELQRRLAARVVQRRTFDEPTLIAGTDVSIRRGEARAAIAVLSLPGLELEEVATAVRPLEFPYVPGLLSFREVPALLAAWERLRLEPEVLVVDGHGLAHPRRFGLACHLGVELDRPAIGCGKSRLCGEHAEPAERRGSRRRLLHRGEVIGNVLRTRTGVRPIYVSVGHRVDLAMATRLLLAPQDGSPEPPPGGRGPGSPRASRPRGPSTGRRRDGGGSAGRRRASPR